jgi:hypothetical protein
MQFMQKIIERERYTLRGKERCRENVTDNCLTDDSRPEMKDVKRKEKRERLRRRVDTTLYCKLLLKAPCRIRSFN